MIVLAVAQTFLASLGQVFFKLAVDGMRAFSWTWAFWKELLTNWWLLACGACYAVATVLWVYIIKNLPFGIAYPLSSLSYVFCMLAALFIFHEQVSVARWIGVFLIMSGCCLVIK